MPARVSKEITNKNDIDMLLSIKEEDVTTSLIMELFGEFDEKAKFHQYDTFTVPTNSYGNEKKRNKKPFVTTIGIWIFNIFFVQNELCDLLGYINYEINSKKWEEIVDKVTRAVMEDDLPLDALDHLLQKSQKMMPLCTVLTPSITDKFLNVSKYIEPKKRELANKYKEELANGDAVTAEKMEKELIAYAMDYLKDDPSLDLYLSGARSNIDNHFKNMYIMKGAIRNPDPNAEHTYDIALSNYNNGISRDEYVLFANALSSGPYARSKKTEIGGYWEKLFVSAYQHIKLLKEGSDCGTTDYIEVDLDKKNVNKWMYSFIIDGKQLVELNSKNMDKYIGKKVKLRFSALCEAKDGICNMCMGNLFYKINAINIGISVGSIASILKNKEMKSFHDSTVKSSVMDPKKAFGE